MLEKEALSPQRERAETSLCESGVRERIIGFEYSPLTPRSLCSRRPSPTLGRGLSAVHALLLLLTLIASFVPTTCAEKPKSSFVFILTDDQRYDALGCAGNAGIKTPHLDSLAEGSAEFIKSCAEANKPFVLVSAIARRGYGLAEALCL